MSERMMRAAVLVSPGRIEVQERLIPNPKAGEVRIRIKSVGVCGSDVHYYYEGRIGSQIIQYPTLLGHEPSGEIDALGEGVSGLSIGTRVAVEPANPCGHCEYCLSGRGNICPKVKFLGTPPYEGIYAEYAVMPAHCCMPIPDSMTFREAALLEPMAVGVHSVELASRRLGYTCAILGAGPIGLMTLLSARLAGASRIYVIDLVRERLEFAKRLGADGVCDGGKENVIKWIESLTNGRGVDVVYEAAGVQETVSAACHIACPGGEVVLIGIPSVDDLSMPMHICRRKELVIRHVRRSNGETLRCMELVSSDRVSISSFATHSFSLSQVTEAFELVHRYGDGVIRAMIEP